MEPCSTFLRRFIILKTPQNPVLITWALIFEPPHERGCSGFRGFCLEDFELRVQVLGCRVEALVQGLGSSALKPSTVNWVLVLVPRGLQHKARAFEKVVQGFGFSVKLCRLLNERGNFKLFGLIYQLYLRKFELFVARLCRFGVQESLNPLQAPGQERNAQ